jgi:hypothetical protein
MLALLGWIVLEQRSFRSHVQTEIAAVRSDVATLRSEVHADIAGLRERMARLEGLFEGHLNREDQ